MGDYIANENVCGECLKKVKQNEEAVQCGGTCSNWFHVACTGLSNEEFKELVDSSDHWFCVPCEIGNSEELYIRSNEDLNDDETTDKVINKDLIEEINSLNSLLNTLSDDLKSAHDEVKRLKAINSRLENTIKVKEESISLLEEELYNLPSSSFLGKPLLSDISKREILGRSLPSLKLSSSLRNSFPTLQTSSLSHIVKDYVQPVQKVYATKVCKTDPNLQFLTKGVNDKKKALKNQRKKLLVAADDHGDNLLEHLEEILSEKFEVCVVYNEEASFDYVAKNLAEMTQNFTHEDQAVLLAGTNDVAYSVDSDVFQHFDINYLDSITSHTNLKLVNIPYRFDKPCLNLVIYKTNMSLKCLAQQLPFTSYIDTSSFSFAHYTRHGLHLNKSGKTELSKLILDSCFSNNNVIPCELDMSL